MITESQIQPIGTFVFRTPYNTNLVEGRMTFFTIKDNSRTIELRIILSICLGDNSCSKSHLAFTEKTNTSRVAADSGNIGAQSFHSTTHTHIAGSTCKLGCSQLSVLIGFLRSSSHASHEHTGKEYMF